MIAELRSCSNKAGTFDLYASTLTLRRTDGLERLAAIRFALLGAVHGEGASSQPEAWVTRGLTKGRVDHRQL